MRIQSKFNLVLLAVFGLGFALTAWIVYRVLLENSKQEVLRNAGLMMETAIAVRSYTVEEIKPPLSPMLETTFLPQTVPAYAAVEVFARLRKDYPEFSYREATLNPTNPRDRSVGWESEIVERFRKNGDKQVMGEMQGQWGPALYLARPIRIQQAACLVCHSQPEAAPASLRARYGDSNGFGWQLGEVVGAQIVTVPTGLAVRNAQSAFWAFSGVLGGLFLALFVILNLMLSRMVVKPILRVASLSDEISVGNLELPEFDEKKGALEIRQLHASFNRMRRSIEKAMRVVRLQKELLKE